MSSKDTKSYLTICDQDGKVIHQGGNLSFRSAIKYRTIYKWVNSQSGGLQRIIYFPWKSTHIIADTDMTVGHAPLAGNYYPAYSSTYLESDRQYNSMRVSGSVGTIPSTDIARVFGGVGSSSTWASGSAGWFGDNLVSLVDVPLDYTQVGTVYIHPATMNNATMGTTLGANYLTFSNNSFFDVDTQRYGGPSFNMLRIETGADAGFYLIQHVDYYTNRVYLQTVEGAAFSAAASATVTVTLCAGRRAWFNEVGVIPLSVGTVDTGTSRYSPRFYDANLRGSFIVRATLDKSGSTEAASATEQQGSYYLSVREYTHGDGGYTYNDVYDGGGFLTGHLRNESTDSPQNFKFWAGGVNGSALDWANQRLWFGYTNANDYSGIAMWRYKTPEQFQEVANYLGTAAHSYLVNPAITLGAGDRIINIEIGSETGSTANWVYVTISHNSGGNGGVAIIKPDLTTLQYVYSTGVLPSLPSANIGASALDKSRARIGTSGDVTTGVGTAQLTSTSGNFASSDIGRALKLTGATADNGTYLIATVVSGTQVTVTTMAGAAVTFAGGANGTFEIGDRLYLLFDQAVTNAGKITYMECLYPGTFLQRAVSMTNGARVLSRSAGMQSVGYGMSGCVSVDPVTGDMYWLSSDTEQQINKYTVSANTHNYIAISNTNLLSPAGGSPSNPGTPSTFTCIKVSSKFDELWVGSSAGHFKIQKSASWAGGTGSPAALSTKRYIGSDNTSYTNPTGVPRAEGAYTNTQSTNLRVRAYIEGPDGRLWTAIRNDSSTTNWASYSREVDSWFYKTEVYAGNGNESWHATIDKYGAVFCVYPSAAYAPSSGRVLFGFTEVQYQWDAVNSVWYPREVVQALLPAKSTSDTIYNPGCQTRPIHSTLEDTFLGVKLRFTRQGGATPPNNEFLGRAGQTRATGTDGQTVSSSSTFTGSSFSASDAGKILRIESPTTNTDGATTLGSSTFEGSGFVSGDVGKYIRINSGADTGTYLVSAYSSGTSISLRGLNGHPMSAKATASSLSYTIDRGADSGIYKIASYLGSTQVTLTRLTGASWTAAASTSSLNYTVWDQGSPGANGGPENITVLLADGFSKDNTQDISGTSFESFGIKTREYVNAEAVKFAVPNPIAPPASTGASVYWETYAKGNALTPQYDAATSHHRALPAPTLGADKSLSFMGVDGSFDGTGNRTTLYSSPSNINDFAGITAADGVLGYSAMVDLGVDVEVGYAIFRFDAPFNGGPRLAYTKERNGMIANLYKANASGGAPLLSSTIRASGVSAISGTTNNKTITLSSGDFLGSVVTGPLSTGSIASSQNTLSAPSSTFTNSDIGRVLVLSGTAGVESGSYRITSVALDGSSATVRNLNQTAKEWSLTASGVTFDVREAVREEDMICVPSLATPTYKLCVERLLTATTAEVRTAPVSSFGPSNWQAVAPSWTPVKRLSYSTEADPPDVRANGTWASINGAEDYNKDGLKVYFDLTDLPVSQRTGRWWKWTAIPRFGISDGNAGHYLKGIELYDSLGKKIAQSRYTSNSEAQTNADFVTSWLNRADWVQSSSSAMSGISGFNGNAGLAGANGNSVTLTTGGNKFLGFQVGPPISDGVFVLGANYIDSASSSFPELASVGRFVRILSGANAGNFYRISGRPSSTRITVVTPSGSPVSWASNETAISFSIHEGINVGGANPDKFVFTSDNREFDIVGLNDSLTAITIGEGPQPTRTNQAWEIRRPAYMARSAVGADAGKLARVLWNLNTLPVQSGDISHDTRGHVAYFDEDIGTGYIRSDGDCGSGSSFSGTGFSPDDVGRLLYIDTGANKGIYEIATYVSASSITVKNHYTGASVTLTADAGPITYRIIGDRRLRLSKYVVGLRS